MLISAVNTSPYALISCELLYESGDPHEQLVLLRRDGSVEVLCSFIYELLSVHEHKHHIFLQVVRKEIFAQDIIMHFTTLLRSDQHMAYCYN